MASHRPTAPAGLIQRFPAGLLPLLSIKESEAPDSLAGVVAPALEMLPFYVADRLETKVATTAGVSSSGAVVSTPVPAGEYWWLYAMNAQASNVGVGSLVQIGCGIQTPEGNVVYFGSMLAPTTSIAGQTFSVPGAFPVPVIARPGCVLFAATFVDPGATTIDLSVSVLFARLSPQ